MSRPPGREPRRRAAAWRAALPLAALALAGVLVAACSSGSTAAATRSTTTTTARSTTTTGRSTTTTTSAVSPTSAPTSTTAAGTTTCLASQLAIAPQQGSGAAGTIMLTVQMSNTSSTTCSLYGYPGMQLLDAQGSPIPTEVVRGGLDPGAPAPALQPPGQVTLSPGQASAFALQYEDVPVGNETTCPTSAKAEITPPNDTTPAVVTLAIAPCGGGTVHVSPVYAAG